MSMLTPLFPYQTAGSIWLSQRTQALLADDMRLGKSAQAIRACDLVGAGSILVLCPAVARVNWQREFQKFSPMDRPSKVIFSGKDSIPPYGVVVCSYDLAVSLSAQLKSRPWDVVILDEAHYLKERRAKRTKMAYGHGKRSPGLVAGYIWRLTGTPAPNNASELWTHLKSASVIDDDYWNFTFRYCTGFEASFGYKVTGHKHVEELKTLIAPFILRRTKEQVFPEMPPITWEEVTVERSQVDMSGFPDATESQIRVADQTLHQALQAIGEADKLSLLESQATNQATLRRFIALAKAPAVAEILAEELKSGELDKVVIFGVHQAAIEEMRQRLSSFNPVVLNGLTPPKQRQLNVDRFTSDPACRVLIGNIQAAGTAIGLHAACEIAFLEQSWVPGDNRQASERCGGPLQTRPIRARVFSLYGSVDEEVQEALLRKIKELSKIF